MNSILESRLFLRIRNGSFTYQIKGTAMGTHAAVVYANLTRGYLKVE